MTIDNGNHLVLSGNTAVRRFLEAIGAQDRLVGPSTAAFPFFDVATGRRWTLRPNDGLIPWWLLDSSRRVPGTRLGEYVAIASLMRRHPGRRIDEVLPCKGPLWELFLRPLFVSVLNTPPEEGSADLAGAVMRETFAKGGRAIHPRAGRFRGERPLSIRRWSGCANPAPTFASAAASPSSKLRTARSPDATTRARAWTRRQRDPCRAALDGRGAAARPGRADLFCAIVNAISSSLAAPAAAHHRPGRRHGGMAWAFSDRLSVTVSAADRLVDIESETLAQTLWRDVAAVHDLPAAMPPCRIVKEKRATFAATPAQDARRPAAATRRHRPFLAGDWTDTGLPATIEGALRSGERAAALAFA